MSTSGEREPLPIWFFVGIILLVYGVIVGISALFPTVHKTVLQELRPGLWWGAMMAVAGAIFLYLGTRGWAGRGKPPGV